METNETNNLAMTFTVLELFTEVKRVLQAAETEYPEVPPNQQGMPMHLRDIASQVATAENLVRILKDRLLTDAEGWEQGGGARRARRRATRKGSQGRTGTRRRRA